MLTCSSLPYRAAFASGSTATSFTSKAPTTTKPVASSTRAVIDMFDGSNGIATNSFVPKYLDLVPFGTTTNDTTFDMRLYGWSKTPGPTPVWIPTLLLDLSCTLCTVACTDLVASGLMVDTIVVNKSGSEATVISPTGNVVANILTHLRGAELIEFDFDLTGAVSGNVLWRAMDEY